MGTIRAILALFFNGDNTSGFWRSQLQQPHENVRF
jgi:hypothetical protein